MMSISFAHLSCLLHSWQPPVGGILLGTSPIYENHWGRLKSRSDWKSHRWTASWAELVWHREAYAGTSFFPKCSLRLKQAKIGARRLGEFVVSIIVSFGPKPGVTEGCYHLTAPAWLIWDELSDMAYFWRKGLCQRKASALGGVRVATVRQAALIRLYIWAGDNKTTI